MGKEHPSHCHFHFGSQILFLLSETPFSYIKGRIFPSSAEPTENFDEVEISEIQKNLEALLDLIENKQDKIGMIEALKFVEPFNNYPEILEKKRKEEENILCHSY